MKNLNKKRPFRTFLPDVSLSEADVLENFEYELIHLRDAANDNDEHEPVMFDDDYDIDLCEIFKKSG